MNDVLPESEITRFIRDYLRDKKHWSILAYHPPGGDSLRYILNPYRARSERLKGAKSPDIVARRFIGRIRKHIILLVENKMRAVDLKDDIEKLRLFTHDPLWRKTFVEFFKLHDNDVLVPCVGYSVPDRTLIANLLKEDFVVFHIQSSGVLTTLLNPQAKLMKRYIC